MRRLLVLLLAVCTLAACATAPAGPSGSQLAVLRERLLVLVSEERQRLSPGAQPLVNDAQLRAAAQAHSDDMARRRAFSNGSNNVAVDTLAADAKFQGFVGENSAAQYFTPGVFDPDMLARVFLDIWLASPGHRENLANPVFERTGIGVAASADMIYAAQVFAADLELSDRN